MSDGGQHVMEVIEITSDEYGKLVGNEVPCFCSQKFLELNADKVEKVHYLVGKDTKNRIAFAIGEKNGEWRAPYSAPFTDIVLLRRDVTVEQIWAFTKAFIEYARENGAKSINIFLPAQVYDFQTTSRFSNALLGNGYKVQFEDINYSFDLNSIDMETYAASIWHMARKNLRIAMNSELKFMRCETIEEKEEAYDVIKINRAYRGYPLRMTKEQVMDTIQIVEHDLFLVKKNEVSVAAAVVYRVTGDTAQVVYWGNIPNVEEYKPINFIAYKLISYYKELNFRVLDIGSSTEAGEPNFGLCTFKESIGCIPSAKCRYQLDFADYMSNFG